MPCPYLKHPEVFIPSVYGNTSGLKKSDIKSLERIYRKRIPKDSIITTELAMQMADISNLVGRQVGVLVGRNGNISHVIVGDAKGIFIPDLTDHGCEDVFFSILSRADGVPIFRMQHSSVGKLFAHRGPSNQDRIVGIHDA